MQDLNASGPTLGFRLGNKPNSLLGRETQVILLGKNYIFILAKDLTFNRGYFSNVVTHRLQVNVLECPKLKVFDKVLEVKL